VKPDGRAVSCELIGFVALRVSGPTRPAGETFVSPGALRGYPEGRVTSGIRPRTSSTYVTLLWCQRHVVLAPRSISATTAAHQRACGRTSPSLSFANAPATNGLEQISSPGADRSRWRDRLPVHRSHGPAPWRRDAATLPAQVVWTQNLGRPSSRLGTVLRPVVPSG
jgi:hypothetical protein